MYQQTYYVDKLSNTPGDVLAANGLARIFRSILDQPGYNGSKRIELRDEGNTYAIKLPSSLTTEMLERCQFFFAIEFIRTPKNATKQPKITKPFDYEAHKEQVSKFFELRRSQPKEVLNDPTHPIYQQLAGLSPNPNWPLVQAVNQMSAISTFNELINRWEDNAGQFPTMLKLLLLMTSTTPNQVEMAETEWQKGVKSGLFMGKLDATALQLFNPACGKGQNNLKSSGLAIGNLNSFWLMEYLKYVGAFEAAAPRLISNPKNPRAKDRKLYVLAAKHIETETSITVWREFQQSFRSNTSVKMDIEAALIYTVAFLDRSQAQAESNLFFELEGNGPENYVSGLWSVFYKDLGNSSAVMNISFIGLPGWIKQVETGEDVAQYKAIITEHRGLFGQLQEDRAEEYSMLLTYRDFVSGQDLTALYDFCADYGHFYMTTIDRDYDRRGRYLRLPTTTNLEVIMANQDPNLLEIVQNEGFQQVAYALRQSTVVLQRNKALNQERLYEPRYGLIQDLKRKGQYKKEFAEALTDFVSTYNLETIQVFERKKGFKGEDAKLFQRWIVGPEHLNAVMGLVEKWGSGLICNLLAAYGSALDFKPKDAAEQEDAPPLDNDISPDVE